MSDVRIKLPMLHDKQRQIAEHAARYKVINAGRRFGKNILLHDVVVNAVLSGQRVGWLSPTYKNMTDDWEKVKDLIGPAIAGKQEDELRIDAITGGVVEFWSGVKPEPIRGRSYDLFVFNEAAYVPDLLPVWNKIVRATLIDRHGRAVFASTPNGMNDFHTVYSKGLGGDAEWQSFHATSFDNPYLDPAEIEAAAKTMTPEEYRQEVLAEFITDAGSVFRNITNATKAMPTTPSEHEGHLLVGGADWGKSDDFTALAVGCATCRREVELDRYNTVDYHFQLQRLRALHVRWNVRQWLVEENSIGTVILEKLQRMKLPVIGFTTSNASKMALIEAFSLDLEIGECTLLPEPVGTAELQAYTAGKTPTGLRTYSAPSGMHDDTVIARALMAQQMRTMKYTANAEQHKRQAATQAAAIRVNRVF